MISKLILTIELLAIVIAQEEIKQVTPTLIEFKWNQKSYLYLKEPRTFDKAEKFCTNKMSRLVQITTPEENQALHTMTQGNRWTWIGGKSALTDPEFQWLDGQAIVYSNWAPGYPHRPSSPPTHTMPIDGCMGMLLRHEGSWDHRYCNHLDFVLCEKLDYSANLVNQDKFDLLSDKVNSMATEFSGFQEKHLNEIKLASVESDLKVATTTISNWSEKYYAVHTNLGQCEDKVKEFESRSVNRESEIKILKDRLSRMEKKLSTN
jgi:hypothetical protein